MILAAIGDGNIIMLAIGLAIGFVVGGVLPQPKFIARWFGG